MTNLEIELDGLRRRSHRAATYAWLRRLRPFDRRSIREPSDRDVYWTAVQARLAVMEHEARTLYADEAPGPLGHVSADSSLALIG